MKIPKIIKKGNFTYEFIEKVHENMYLYQEKDLGFKTTFCDHDLGLIKEDQPRPYIKNYIKAM